MCPIGTYCRHDCAVVGCWSHENTSRCASTATEVKLCKRARHHGCFYGCLLNILEDSHTRRSQSQRQRQRQQLVTALSREHDTLYRTYEQQNNPGSMSDHEGGGVPALDDELSLPKATVAKMISGAYIVLDF